MFDKREDSHRTALDMFDIADKYLIADLRQKAMSKICRDVSMKGSTSAPKLVQPLKVLNLSLSFAIDN
jgi:hypothetical protein